MDKELIMKLLSDPDTFSTLISTMITTYKPMFYKVLGELFSIYKDYVDNPEIYEYKAKGLMNTYQELVKVGFTEEQAFTLLIDKETRMENMLNNIANNSKINVSE